MVAAGAEDTAGEDTAGEDTAAEDAADVPLGTVIGTPAALQRAPLTPRASSLNIDVSTTHAHKIVREKIKYFVDPQHCKQHQCKS